MAEYIEREKLLEIINSRIEVLRKEYGDFDEYTDGLDECIDRIEDFPSADVAPVRHGRWIVLDDCANEGLYCSECKKRIYKKVPNVMPNFCSNCGSDMRNVNDNPEMLEEYRWEMTR